MENILHELECHILFYFIGAALQGIKYNLLIYSEFRTNFQLYYIIEYTMWIEVVIEAGDLPVGCNSIDVGIDSLVLL